MERLCYAFQTHNRMTTFQKTKMKSFYYSLFSNQTHPNTKAHWDWPRHIGLAWSYHLLCRVSWYDVVMSHKDLRTKIQMCLKCVLGSSLICMMTPIPGPVVLTTGSSLRSYIVPTDQHKYFVHILSSLMCTRENSRSVTHPKLLQAKHT
jgi:hypothetical protein